VLRRTPDALAKLIQEVKKLRFLLRLRGFA